MEIKQLKQGLVGQKTKVSCCALPGLDLERTCDKNVYTIPFDPFILCFLARKKDECKKEIEELESNIKGDMTKEFIYFKAVCCL